MLDDNGRVMGNEEVLALFCELLAETSATINGCLDRIDARLDSLDQMLTRMGRGFDDMDRAIDRMGHGLSRTLRNADGLEKSLYDLAQRRSPINTWSSRPRTYHTGVEFWTPEGPITRRLGHMG